jgi:DNA-binding MurR/RpiR family transcriptional regulator
MTDQPESMAATDLFAERVQASGVGLAPAARRVVTFIDQNRAFALASSAMDLATRTGTSDATVIRAVQALGFAGLGDVKQALLASIDNPTNLADDMRRTLDDLGEVSDTAIDMVFDAHAEAMETLRTPESRARLLAAVSTLHVAERIVVFGIGPSAALASYAATLLGRAGRRTASLTMTGIMLADQMLDLRPRDALLVLAYGRAYREVMAVLGEARRLGSRVVLMTDSPGNKLVPFANVVLPLPRGRTERVALHGATLVALEGLVLGLAAANGNGAIAALDRLNSLRKAVSGQHYDVGDPKP